MHVEQRDAADERCDATESDAHGIRRANIVLELIFERAAAQVGEQAIASLLRRATHQDHKGNPTKLGEAQRTERQNTSGLGAVCCGVV